jgi:MFS family permease
VDRDLFVLGLTRVLRSFSFSYTVFLVPIYLRSSGFSVELVGVYAFLATLSSSGLLVASGFLGDLYSRKKTLIWVMSLPCAAYTVFILTQNRVALLSTSLLGLSLGGVGGGAGGGPVAPLQTAMIAGRVSGARRTQAYSYFTVASTVSGVAGSLFSSYIIRIESSGYPRILFSVALALSVASVAAAWLLSEDPDRPRVSQQPTTILPRRSSASALRIALAGALGSVGLGLVTPLMPLYFEAIGASDLIVSYIYDVGYAVSAALTLVSARIERAVGTIKSVLLLRSVGTLLLAAIPFIHMVPLAAAIYVARNAAYQSALPIRQNVSMGLYSPEERSRASSITGLARRLPYGASTIAGSILFAAGQFTQLFGAAAGISFLDPLLYYAFFRNLDKQNIPRKEDAAT